ncbi:MAG: lamin tail domain-containing protein, partial [Myxococcaceae bacterium]|nr:lamin tail domain-containing protein [Myxococcaceae bacterium]
APNGGDPIVLSWNVTNAREVRITDPSGALVFNEAGLLDTGSVTVYPNRASVTYTLNASNGVGSAIAPQTLAVGVTNVARLTFEQPVPVGAIARVTGHTVVGGTEIFGLPTVVKNSPGEAFIDISNEPIADGGVFIVNAVTDTSSDVTELPEPFVMPLFGQRVTITSISTSPNGWFFPSDVANDGPTSNGPIGSSHPGLTIAPYFRDLFRNDTDEQSILGRFDTVGTDRRLIVQFTDFEDWSFSGSRVTFQAQLYSSGKVVFAYGKLQGVTATGPAGIGLTNGSSTGALNAPSQPLVTDTFTFFLPPPSLPVDVRVENAPYQARVRKGNQLIDVEGDPRFTPNQFSITEANPRPGAGLTNAEWFEVTNNTAQPIDLQNWLINFGGGNTHVIASSVVLPANGRIVLAQSANLGDPTAGITAAYVYPATLVMPDAAGAVSIDLGGAPYARLEWDATATATAGVSVQAGLPPPAGPITFLGAAMVCPSPIASVYGVQSGTPLAVGTRCFYVPSVLATGGFESIAATGTRLSSSDALDEDDEEMYPVVLPTPVRPFGVPVTTLYVCSNGWITTTDNDSSYGNKSEPDEEDPLGTIAVFWDDWEKGVSPTSGVYWQQRDPDATPATGDEYTIVSWEGWKPYTFGAAYDGESYNFQVKLFANGDIEYHFGAMTGVEPMRLGGSATTWLETPNGRSAFAVNVNDDTPGIAPNSAYRFTFLP